MSQPSIEDDGGTSSDEVRRKLLKPRVRRELHHRPTANPDGVSLSPVTLMLILPPAQYIRCQRTKRSRC